MQEREKIRQLFERYRSGRCTPEELTRLHAWLNQYAKNEAQGLDDLEESYNAEHAIKKTRWLRWFPYAAAVIIVTLVSVWYVGTDPAENLKPKIANLKPGDIAPGGNRATLTLADGRSIDLSEAESEIVVGGEHISYASGSEELVDLKDEEISLLVLATPKGGTYQITLSDGTKVWLNAESTLKYPSRFVGEERVVEIEGEAYFAVTKDSNKPFKVHSRGQQIEVLGTEFNISAYTDEHDVKTTLVTGSVELKVNASGERMALVPSEQSVLSGDMITKQTVDVGPYIAWKDGHFNFDNTTLADMMKQMERWYDVEVIFESGVPNEQFSGTMSRDVSLQTVLELLHISGINYRIQGNDLIIE
ncbi:FecR family protein [Parapedobacter sp. 10938]|uniref:FecR family protein n=1 Tax=Parapedobacter flavus TaxID=3110225 RepID=UPI002DB7BFC6|nr:FecR family protein [Parapedobacter sp. 10938]MEC3879459.1 FecR family protein [Parapedobacter sp. 10938]